MNLVRLDLNRLRVRIKLKRRILMKVIASALSQGNERIR
jgi:hypothetical protein